MTDKKTINIAGISVSNPDKLWWPDEKITKLDVVRYYADHADIVNPWLKGKLLTSERCPDGVKGSCFYQKDFPSGLPEGVPTFPLYSEHNDKDIQYILGGSKKTLVAMVNMGNIAIHVMNANAKTIDEPDWIAFDMDPETGGFEQAAKAGLALRIILDEHGLVSFPKTSGSRGLHIMIPLKRGHTQQEVRDFAQKIGGELAFRNPKLVTTEFSKAKRGGKVFADALRNAKGQTMACTFSVRRKPGAPVSTPLWWDEVSPKLVPWKFTIRTIDRRLAKEDPWKDFWKSRQRLEMRV